MRGLKYFYSFQLQSWIIWRVRTKFLLRNFHAKRVIFEIAMMNIFNNCIAGSLSNNYFPLNESPSLYQQCFVYSITAWKNNYLKIYCKTFNTLILAPYSYPKQTITPPRVIILTKFTVVRNMSFNVHLFLFFRLWICLEKIVNYVLKVWTKHDFAVFQTLGNDKWVWNLNLSACG